MAIIRPFFNINVSYYFLGDDMGLLGKILGTDKAIDGVVSVAKSGMEIWDSNSFTAQERSQALLHLIKATSQKETSISRRILLWAIILKISLAMLIGAFWIQTGQPDKLALMIEMIEALKIGYAFAGAIGFYYLTHLVNGSGKK